MRQNRKQTQSDRQYNESERALLSTRTGSHPTNLALSLLCFAEATLLYVQTICTLKIWSQARATEHSLRGSVMESTGLISLQLSLLPLLEGILI